MDYIPNTENDRSKMLSKIGAASLDELFKDIPIKARLTRCLKLPAPLSEPELVSELKAMANRNISDEDNISFLGGGSYNHYIPSVVNHLVKRSEFYTAYTPYQAELSQGMLQAIYEFQTLLCNLTKMDVSNASMYDGATATTEAISLACRHTKRKNVLVASSIHPEFRNVINTYARFAGWNIKEAANNLSGTIDLDSLKSQINDEVACVVISQPNFFGCIEASVNEIADIAHSKKALFIVIIDPISLGILKPPGEYGADIVTGEGKSLGSPQSFGGPGLGLFAVKKELVRLIPGRLCGATVDNQGRRGFTLTLQTREQHIRRERATSNICSNQALNALAAAVYLSALGKLGLKKVAELCIKKANYAKEKIKAIKGFSVPFSGSIFKEFVVLPPKKISRGLSIEKYFPKMKNHFLISLTELATKQNIDNLIKDLNE